MLDSKPSESQAVLELRILAEAGAVPQSSGSVWLLVVGHAMRMPRKCGSNSSEVSKKALCCASLPLRTVFIILHKKK